MRYARELGAALLISTIAAIPLGLWIGAVTGVGLIAAGVAVEVVRSRRAHRHRKPPQPSSAVQEEAVSGMLRSPRMLSGLEREELRALIAEGELLRSDPVLVEDWTERVRTWLEAHGQGRHAKAFGRAGAVKRRLVALRVALTESIPQGFDLDLTTGEALERWMDVENIPSAVRTALRERHAALESELTDA